MGMDSLYLKMGTLGIHKHSCPNTMWWDRTSFLSPAAILKLEAGFWFFVTSIASSSFVSLFIISESVPALLLVLDLGDQR